MTRHVLPATYDTGFTSTHLEFLSTASEYHGFDQMEENAWSDRTVCSTESVESFRPDDCIRTGVGVDKPRRVLQGTWYTTRPETSIGKLTAHHDRTATTSRSKALDD